MAELDKSWYTKYRPKTMDEYLSPTISKVVKQRFKKREDMPHVIMIEGTRGTGKTTFSRLISKYFLCENPHEDGTPCEMCQTCQEINEILIGGETGMEAPGVREVDATTANGKEAIQEIIEDAIIPPMYTQYKILIMDEFHMVTVAAQNSLLKIVEDIPPHLVVIFATTNPEKVLQTIKSRCQLKLEAKKQTIPDMVSRLAYIAEKEKCKTSEKALEIIAKKGDRVPRECINILESVAKTYDRDVSVDNVRDYLGDAGSELYMEYFRASNAKNLVDIMEFISKLRNLDVKMGEFTNGLLTFVLDALYIKHGINVDEYPIEYVKQVKKLFDTYESQDFDMLLQVLETADRSISPDNDKKNEVTLVIAAMRIGKIKLLSSGLANIQEQAIAENKISMYEHSKLLSKKQHEISEQLKLAITPAMLKEEFDNATVVADDMELDNTPAIPRIDISEIEDMHKKNKVATTEIKTGNSEVDDFFDSI